VSSADGDHLVGQSIVPGAHDPHLRDTQAKNADSLYTAAGGECQPSAV